MYSFRLTTIIFIVLVSILCGCDAKNKFKITKRLLREKETNPLNFMRLAAMRMIYGVATRVGFGEQISEALGGAFVPPGVDDYDYDDGDDDLFGREDYDDY